MPHEVDPAHPLVAAFKGQPFVHVDEPYLFKNAYADKNFRPLLSMDTDLDGTYDGIPSINLIEWLLDESYLWLHD